MHTPLLIVALLFAAPDTACSREMDLARLREMLHDRLDARAQSQAALLLVQSSEAGADKLVRQGLRLVENEETFLALAAAVRLEKDSRFLDELLAALASARPRVRQAAAEALSVLPGAEVIRRLQGIARDNRNDVRLRQAALWALGRSGRKAAAAVLVTLLDEGEETSRLAGLALSELTGQNLGSDVRRWKEWWARHKDVSNERWLHMRLSFQTSRALRLEGDLLRSRAQVLRLHQQLYSRLTVAERLGYLQALLDQDDAGVRALVVVWSVELLPAADATRRATLSRVLLRLTHDGSTEVQRGAVLALGRVQDPAAVARLDELLKKGPALVRAAAVRALAMQARGSAVEARARQKEVIGVLQKALEDRALEVVVEAAEALGALGAPEAGPVLTGLLRHPSEHVRQTAAQALERMADPSLIEGLLRGLDDPAVMVRFSLVGALGKAAGNGQTLLPAVRKKVLARLEVLLAKDADAGVRGRAATVLGECADASFLTTLWQQVQTGSEERVQEKAWDAFVEIVTRSASLELMGRWDRTLAEAKQSSRRLQLLARVYARWEQRPETREVATKALESLVQAQVDLGKWAAAAPLAQNLLARTVEGGEATRARCLQWLARIAALALKDGNRAEALRIIQDARTYVGRSDSLAEEFDRLEKQARRE